MHRKVLFNQLDEAALSSARLIQVARLSIKGCTITFAISPVMFVYDLSSTPGHLSSLVRVRYGKTVIPAWRALSYRTKGSAGITARISQQMCRSCHYGKKLRLKNTKS